MKLCRGKFGQKQRAPHQCFRQREIPGDGQDVSSNIKLLMLSMLIKINQICSKPLAYIRKKFPSDQFN